MIQRKRISITVNPTLVDQVDTFVAEHPNLDRSKVFDEALALWYAARQEQAMISQFSQEADRAELDEIEAWRGVQREAAASLFQRR